MTTYKFTRMQIVFTLLTICFVAFIFNNSLQIGEVSSKHSGAVLKLFQDILRFLGIPLTITEHFIRKSAHFCEYTGLGLLLGVTLRMYTKRILNHIFIPLFIGLAVPVTDEYIQLFVEGRGSMVQDVVLDFTGVLTGLTAAVLFVLVIDRRKHSGKKEEISE